MGRAQSSLLLSPSLLLEFYLLNGRRYRDRTFTTKWNALSRTLAPVSQRCNIVCITGQLVIVLIRSTMHHGLSKTKIKMCQAQIRIMVSILLQELQSSVRPGPRIRAGGRPATEKSAVQSASGGKPRINRILQNISKLLRFMGLHMVQKSLHTADFGLHRTIFGLPIVCTSWKACIQYCQFINE